MNILKVLKEKNIINLESITNENIHQNTSSVEMCSSPQNWRDFYLQPSCTTRNVKGSCLDRRKNSIRGKCESVESKDEQQKAN